MSPPAVLHLRSSGGLFGADRVVLDLCLELGKTGYRAVLVPLVEPGGAGEALRAAGEAAGIRVRPLALATRLDLGAIGALRRLARDERAAILHGHDYKSNTLIRMAGLGGVRRVATLHGRVGTDAKLRLYEALETRLVRRFDRVVCVSERMRAAEAERGLAAVVVHNGIDLGPFRGEPGIDPAARAAVGLPLDAEVIGSIGRLSAEKGYDTLLRAAARLLATRPRLHVLMVGDGPLKRSLEDLARSAGLRSRVRFAGLRNDAALLYRAFDVFCMPSHREGLPLALLEALASARAAVVTPVGGMPEVVGSTAGRNGGPPGAPDPAATGGDFEPGERVALTVAPGDAASLAAAVGRLLDDPGLRARLGVAARRRVEARFSRAQMARATAGLYDALLGAARHPPPGT
jgi:glycosyltransferase involved in cell wall biosynthesis